VPDRPWQAHIPSATRAKILRGKVPKLIHDERPAYAPGDRVILEWGKGADTQLGVTITYAERWLTIVKVSADGARWITEYAPPASRPDYLRRGSGYTSDPFLSADPQVEAEHFEVTPEARAENTLTQERRRLESELHRHLARWRRGSETTRGRLYPVIQSCRDKLAQLQERSDR
jgi:hypothetical protein